MSSTAQQTGSEAAFTLLYEEHLQFLLDLTTSRFRVPPAAAEDVVNEVFLSYFSSGTRVREPRAWLVAAVCNGSRRYWMKRHALREEPIDSAPEPAAGIDEFLHELTVRQVVGRLHRRCQETLVRHYWHGDTAREVAQRLGTTQGYAQKIIHQCLRKAFAAWHELWGDA